MAVAGGEFVDGWVVAQILGEGAYGEVRLLVHARSGAQVALKAVRVSGGEGEGAGAAREAALQRALRHPHVLRCLGARQHQHMHYMFLEYAAGGELFDQIEPDVGMGERAARRYWRQLLAGVGYLHARGVAHRDIKPENLLLDQHLNLKISDFGMATIFRHGSRERLVSSVCGTVPYAAPEVLAGAGRGEGGQAGGGHRAEPADLWSCAVVLIAMLAGELPWERAQLSDPRFAAWAAGGGAGEAGGGTGDAGAGVWRRLRRGARALLAGALRVEASRRAALPDLLAHAWTSEEAAPHEGVGADRLWWSQPVCEAGGSDTAGAELSAEDMEALASRSQPCAADMQLARRATRMRLAAGAGPAREQLAAALASLACSWRAAGERALVVRAPDGRMRAWLWPEPDGATLLELRRERGCGLAFRRRFLRLRDLLRPHLDPHDPDGTSVPAFLAR